ncbi:DUF1793 domain-containing protein [Bacteroides thetaiotaomicron]|nr:DUF1793 domain-containing protein [Bacteroides thetaiotaomicron]
MWTAAMSPDQVTFEKFIAPSINTLMKLLHGYLSATGITQTVVEWVSFRARSVIGGYWMQVLMNKRI